MRSRAKTVVKTLLISAVVGVAATAFAAIESIEEFSSADSSIDQHEERLHASRIAQESIALKEAICQDVIDERISMDEAINYLMQIDADRPEIIQGLRLKYGSKYSPEELIGFRLRDQIQRRLWINKRNNGERRSYPPQHNRRRSHSRETRTSSSQEFFDDRSMNVGQTEITSLIPEHELLVVETEPVQDGGL